jgi:hypothetical protein
MPQPIVQPPALRVDLANQILRELRRKLNISQVELLKHQTWFEAEARKGQAFQRGFDIQQQTCILMFEEHDKEMAKSHLDLELAEKLIVAQKEIIDCQGLQQQPATNLVGGGPLLPHYNDPNQSYQAYQAYQAYQPPRNQEFVMDPTSLRQLDDYDYNIGSPIDSSCDTELAISNAVPESDQHTSSLSMPSILHPVSAEPDVPAPINSAEGAQGALEDEGAKPNKKRRIK